jgi:chromosome segregation ATPase
MGPQEKLVWLAEDKHIEELRAYVEAMPIKQDCRNVLSGLLFRRETMQAALAHSIFQPIKERTVGVDKQYKSLQEGFQRLTEHVLALGEEQRAKVQQLDQRLSSLAGGQELLDGVQEEMKRSTLVLRTTLEDALEALESSVSEHVQQVPKVDETRAMMQEALRTVEEEQRLMRAHLSRVEAGTGLPTSQGATPGASSNDSALLQELTSEVSRLRSLLLDLHVHHALEDLDREEHQDQLDALARAIKATETRLRKEVDSATPRKAQFMAQVNTVIGNIHANAASFPRQKAMGDLAEKIKDDVESIMNKADSDKAGMERSLEVISAVGRSIKEALDALSS